MKNYTDENEIPKRVYFDNILCKVGRNDQSKRCCALQKPVWGTYKRTVYRWGKREWIYKADKKLVCPKCGRKTRFIFVWDPKDFQWVYNKAIERLKYLNSCIDHRMMR